VVKDYVHAWHDQHRRWRYDLVALSRSVTTPAPTPRLPTWGPRDYRQGLRKFSTGSFAPRLITALMGPVRNVHWLSIGRGWLSIGSGDALSTKPDLASTVYDLLNEAVDSGLLSDGLGGDPRWLREDAEPSLLAVFLARYGGGEFGDGPDVLHGVREDDLLPHCAGWLAAWREADAEDRVPYDGIPHPEQRSLALTRGRAWSRRAPGRRSSEERSRRTPRATPPAR